MIDLKPGMIVEECDGKTGQRRCVLLIDNNSGYLLTGRDANGNKSLPDFTVELDGFTTLSADPNDIFRVFGVERNLGYLHDLVVHEDAGVMKPLWQRRVKMTRAELRERLGFDVELVD